MRSVMKNGNHPQNNNAGSGQQIKRILKKAGEQFGKEQHDQLQRVQEKLNNDEILVQQRTCTQDKLDNNEIILEQFSQELQEMMEKALHSHSKNHLALALKRYRQVKQEIASNGSLLVSAVPNAVIIALEADADFGIGLIMEDQGQGSSNSSGLNHNFDAVASFYQNALESYRRAYLMMCGEVDASNSYKASQQKQSLIAKKMTRVSTQLAIFQSNGVPLVGEDDSLQVSKQVLLAFGSPPPPPPPRALGKENSRRSPISRNSPASKPLYTKMSEITSKPFQQANANHDTPISDIDDISMATLGGESEASEPVQEQHTSPNRRTSDANNISMETSMKERETSTLLQQHINVYEEFTSDTTYMSMETLGNESETSEPVQDQNMTHNSRLSNSVDNDIPMRTLKNESETSKPAHEQHMRHNRSISDASDILTDLEVINVSSPLVAKAKFSLSADPRFLDELERLPDPANEAQLQLERSDLSRMPVNASPHKKLILEKLEEAQSDDFTFESNGSQEEEFVKVLDTLTDRAEEAFANENYNEARRHYHGLTAILSAASKSESRLTLRADATYRIGNISEEQDNCEPDEVMTYYEEALEFYNDALAMCAGKPEREDLKREVTEKSCVILSSIAGLYGEQEEWDEAMQTVEVAIRLLNMLVEAHGYNDFEALEETLLEQSEEARTNHENSITTSQEMSDLNDRKAKSFFMLGDNAGGRLAGSFFEKVDKMIG
jgi:tetratricopeptide (TPR) repeat protein